MSNDRRNQITLAAIAKACDGRLIGDPKATVSQVASVESATEDCLTFVATPQALIRARQNQQSNKIPGVVLLDAQASDQFNGHRIVVSDPYLAYARVSVLFVPRESDSSPRIDPTAHIDDSAIIGQQVSIGPFSVVGRDCIIAHGTVLAAHVVIENESRIGANCTVESGVVIGSLTVMGVRCTISAGVVIGSNGFGYAPSSEGWQKIHQLGGVTIGDDVDIGANTTIDRGAIDNTVIGDRVKLDNQIQIAHNVRVGDDTIMAGCVGVAGSAVIGKRCQLGGRANVLGHLTIVDDVILNAGAFVTQSIDNAGTYSSIIPARPVKQWRKTVAQLNRLDKLAEKIKNTGSKK